MNYKLLYVLMSLNSCFSCWKFVATNKSSLNVLICTETAGNPSYETFLLKPQKTKTKNPSVNLCNKWTKEIKMLSKRKKIALQVKIRQSKIMHERKLTVPILNNGSFTSEFDISDYVTRGCELCNPFLNSPTSNNFNKELFKREVESTVNSTSMGVDTYNETDEDYLQWIKDSIKPWTWMLIACHGLVFVIGLFGNTLVCIAVYRNQSMRTVTNYFITNLAVADFLVILACLPPSVIWDVTMTWFFGDGMCKVVLYLQTVSVTVSVLTLTFISIERWYAICFPLKFKSTTGRAKTAILVIWVMALLFDIPELVVYHTKRRLPIDTIYFTQCEPSWSNDRETTWIIIKMILLYAVPLAFMTITYCQIISVLWKSGRVNHRDLDIVGNTQLFTFSMASNASTRGQLRSRKKAAKMLVSVVVMFALCFFPVHLLSVLRMTVKLTNSDLNRAFASISHWLCYLNSAVNPVIYNFMSGKCKF